MGAGLEAVVWLEHVWERWHSVQASSGNQMIFYINSFIFNGGKINASNAPS